MQEQLTVQAYVMDSYEQMNIREMVLDELLNGDGVTDMQYREKLLAIQDKFSPHNISPQLLR